jgi:1-acyl-sn-glycerol-3-phosphate acyltransferase
VSLPPAWVRRPLALAVLGAATWGVLSTPWPAVVVGLGAVSTVVPGRWRPVRLLAFAVVGVLLEAAGVLAFAALTVAYAGRLRGEASQLAHLAVLRVLLQVLVGAARVLFGLRLDTDEVSWSPLDDGTAGSENAMLVLSRHAGPGDSLLLVHTLLNRDHLRRPRIVLKDTLALDPLVDLYLHRLPSAFVRAADGPEVVGGLARGLAEEDALLLFPEGGNVTPERRVRAIASLRRKGMRARAARAEQLQHLLPPRPGGVLAALAAAPHADVVFVAHTGLEHLDSVRDIWHGLPLDTRLLLRWWFVPAGEVPEDPGAQTDWLDDRWAELDAWVARRA